MHPKRAPVIDKVIVRYTGLKASLITQAELPNAIQILKTDLGVLRLPLPPTANISVVEKGVMEFWWETKVGSTLDHTLHSKLEPKTDEDKAYLEKALKDLLIDALYLVPPPRKNQHPRGPSMSQNSNSSPEKAIKYRNLSWTRPKDDVLQHQAQMLLDDIGEQIQIKNTESEEMAEPTVASGSAYHSSSTFSQTNTINIESATLPASALNPVSMSITKPIPSAFSIPIPPHDNPTFSSNSAHASTQLQPYPSTSQSHSAKSSKPTVAPTQDNVPQLLSELAEIRRQLHAGLEKEQEIIDELKRMNAPNIPEASPSGMMSAGSELIFKTRIKMIEKQLDEERRKRKAAEEGLKDVERECKEPFVVPALLEAFLMLSNLTSQVVDEV